MKYFRFIFHIDVIFIHLMVRAIILEFSSDQRAADRRKRTEMDYLQWEQPHIFLLYCLPLLAYLTAGFVPFVIFGILSIFVSILRSIEHIDKNIIN